MGTELLINKAINAALLAGEKIKEIYASNDFEIVEKDDFSPLTKADREAHQKIVNILESTKIPVLSEEGIHLDFAERSLWKSFWLVDPLDGTKEFISRNGEFTVNIALIRENRPIAGVIFIPVSGELYLGIVDEGAWKISNPELDITFKEISEKGTKLPIAKSSAGYIVAASRSHLNAETLAFIEDLKRDHPELEIIRKGSSLKMCMVAEGTASIYPKLGTTMEWDTAAGHAILKASGKNIFNTDLMSELTYNKENLQNPHFIAV
ncbi:MAG TPA: 3'(2'),5'-bisphosphate nucleotidase [Prolixibacteraceae bacterium]|nr:3'(2'),5'-bisphosphate nucleotidase [Prolixibacteraceae bacterium]